MVLGMGQIWVGNYVIKRIRICNWLLNWAVLGLNFVSPWASILLFEATWSRKDLSELDGVRVGGEASWIWLSHSIFNGFVSAISVFGPCTVSSTSTSICTYAVSQGNYWEDLIYSYEDWKHIKYITGHCSFNGRQQTLFAHFLLLFYAPLWVRGIAWGTGRSDLKIVSGSPIVSFCLLVSGKPGHGYGRKDWSSCHAKGEVILNR